MTPTDLDVAAFSAHVADRSAHCLNCHRADRLQLNRIALMPDAAPGAHLGEVAEPADEEATPVAVVLCKHCLSLQFFAWLPIAAAFERSLSEALAALEAPFVHPRPVLRDHADRHRNNCL